MVHCPTPSRYTLGCAKIAFTIFEHRSKTWSGIFLYLRLSTDLAFVMHVQNVTILVPTYLNLSYVCSEGVLYFVYLGSWALVN